MKTEAAKISQKTITRQHKEKIYQHAVNML